MVYKYPCVSVFLRLPKCYGFHHQGYCFCSSASACAKRPRKQLEVFICWNHLISGSLQTAKASYFFAGPYTSFSIQRSLIHVCKQSDLKSTIARNRWFWNPYFGTVYRMQQKGLGSLMYGLKDAWLMDLALTNLDKGQWTERVSQSHSAGPFKNQFTSCKDSCKT